MSGTTSSGDASESAEPPGRLSEEDEHQQVPTGRFDVIVAGLGVIGLAVCRELARRGLSVLGLEQYDLHHNQGSSHGSTRIIRRSGAEGPGYTPLIERAYESWRALEDETGETLINRCGLLVSGPKDSEIIRGIVAANDAAGIACERLTRDDIAGRFPGMNPEAFAESLSIFEADAGYLYAERALEALALSARHRGAVLRDTIYMSEWRAAGEGVEVETEEGVFAAKHLVMSLGAWMKPVLAEYGIELSLSRKLHFWFLPADDALIRPPAMPAFGIDTPGGFFYGVPDNQDTPEDGLKIGRHDEDRQIREVSWLEAGEEMLLQKWIDEQEELVRPGVEWFARHTLGPALLAGDRPEIVPSDMAVCMYSMSPDRNFILGRLPGNERISVAAGFSGTGFKFAPVVAELLAEEIEGKEWPGEAHFLSIRRFLRAHKT